VKEGQENRKLALEFGKKIGIEKVGWDKEQGQDRG
jgi:hypothetical protein